jgi:hypothetical protein
MKSVKDTSSWQVKVASNLRSRSNSRERRRFFRAKIKEVRDGGRAIDSDGRPEVDCRSGKNTKRSMDNERKKRKMDRRQTNWV